MYYIYIYIHVYYIAIFHIWCLLFRTLHVIRHVSEYYAEKENIMWDKMSNYVVRGNNLISSIHDKKMFHGWQGAPDGCRMKQVTIAALNVCSPIASDKISQIFVYLDGSSAMCDSEAIMSWGFCCFNVC